MAVDAFKMLTGLGLSQTETKVYLASLELGPTSVQDIAKKARLSRTATYDAIASLQQSGLMSTFDRGKKRFFSAADPDQAVGHFKDRVTEMERQLDVFKAAVPELKLVSGGDRPSVRFYEGKEAIYAAFHDLEKVRPPEMMELTNVDDVYAALEEDVLLDARKVLSSNPKMKIRTLHRGKLRNPQERVEYCELDPTLGNFHGNIWIYDHHIVFVTFIGKLVCVIIENKELTSAARMLFEAAWRVCGGATSEE